MPPIRLRALTAAMLAALAVLALPSAAPAAGPLTIGIGEQRPDSSRARSGPARPGRALRRGLGRAVEQAAARRDRRLHGGGEERRRARAAGLRPFALALRGAPQDLHSPRPSGTSSCASGPATRSSGVSDLERGEPPRPPTWNHPGVVGRYYDILRNNCRGCTIVGPSVLDSITMPRLGQAGGEGRRSTGSASGRSTTTSTPTASARAARARCCARRRRGSGSPRPAGWCAATTARGSSSPTRRARGQGDEVGAQARAPEPARPARLLLPLDRAEPDGHLGSALTDRRGRPRPADVVVRTFVRGCARRARARRARAR